MPRWGGSASGSVFTSAVRMFPWTLLLIHILAPFTT